MTALLVTCHDFSNIEKTKISKINKCVNILTRLVSKQLKSFKSDDEAIFCNTFGFWLLGWCGRGSYSWLAFLMVQFESYSYSAACVLAFNFSCKSIALFFQGFLNSLLANVHLFTNSQLTTLKFMPGLVSSPYYFLSSIYTMPPPPLSFIR